MLGLHSQSEAAISELPLDALNITIDFLASGSQAFEPGCRLNFGADFVTSTAVAHEAGIRLDFSAEFLAAGTQVFQPGISLNFSPDTISSGAVVFDPLIYSLLPERIAHEASLRESLLASVVLSPDPVAEVVITSIKTEVKLVQEPVIQ